MRKLADVARPRVVAAEPALDPGDDLPRELGTQLLPHLPLRQEQDEVGDLPRRVAAPLGERRRLDPIGAQPVVEILPKAAGAHLAAQIAVRRRHDLAPEAPLAGVAEALEDARFEDPQELDLNGAVHLADLVEEDRTQRRTGLEMTGAVADGAGEGAAAVAEELGFDQRRRQSRQVEGKEGFLRALGESVGFGIERDIARHRDGARHQLLAGPRGTGDEGRQVAHPAVQDALVPAQVVSEDGLPDLGPQPRHRPRAADDRMEGGLEGAADLKAAGEKMGRIEWGPPPAGGENVIAIRGELGVEPEIGTAAGRGQGGMEPRLVAIVKEMEGDVLVEPDLLRRGPGSPDEPLPHLLDETGRALDDPRLVRVLPRGIVPRMPDGIEGDVLPAQRPPLPVDPLGHEGVDVGEVRDRGGEVAFGVAQHSHVQGMYSHGHPASKPDGARRARRLRRISANR
jgi:hypothetical protein